MEEPRWIKREWLDAMHADQIKQHGGSLGVRDEGLIESALMRPRNRWLYEADVDLALLAATYAHGLAKNHGFIDGNKRIAFLVMYVFLGMNGWRLVASEPEVVDRMVGLASSAIDDAAFADWIRNHIQPR